jgi:hypothetical protein
VTTLFAQLSTFARSDQGRQLYAQAKKVTADPDTRRKIDDAWRRLATRGARVPPPRARTRSR